MTDAQIEAAARELCRMRGLDPDAPACNPRTDEAQFLPGRRGVVRRLFSFLDPSSSGALTGACGSRAFLPRLASAVQSGQDSERASVPYGEAMSR